MKSKIFLPTHGRNYVVTLSEQADLACRYGITSEKVELLLAGLGEMMLSGLIEPQRTATKTKRLIGSHIESSNVMERQGA